MSKSVSTSLKKESSRRTFLKGVTGTAMSAALTSTAMDASPSSHLTGSRSTKLVADKLITEVVDNKFDLIALPGLFLPRTQSDLTH